MPKITQFQCDCGCNSIRQDSNRWWMVRTDLPGWSICEWDDALRDLPGILYAAGQSCAHLLLDQFMSSAQEKVIGGKDI
jgi:hypothetical protein